MIGKTIQKIRVTTIFTLCILIYIFLIGTEIFVIHLIGGSLERILVSEDVGGLEKT